MVFFLQDKQRMSGSFISQATEAYWLDPVATMNRGLRTHDASAEFSLMQNKALTKLPGVAYPEPVIRSIKMSQASGQHAFQSYGQRQKASCTRPQLDMMPNRMASEYHPVPATTATVIEPFPRQGSNARWLAKDR